MIQIWAWPGTGKQALLEGLGEEDGARALAVGEVDGEERLRSTLSDPQVAAARWLVCLDLPRAGLEAACRLLRPGQRLVWAGFRRLDPNRLPVSFLTPEELLLDPDEALALWRCTLQAAGGGEGDSDRAALLERLRPLTAGWYTPLRLVARAAAEGRLDEGVEDTADSELLDRLLALPAIEAFLAHEVVGPLPSAAREALTARARGEAHDAGALAAYGLGGQGPGGAALPELLAGFLRGRTGSPHPRTSTNAHPRPQVRIALLGPPRVTLVPETAGEPEVEVHWPLQRALKILAYLASAQDFHASRDDLIAALWPEDDEEKIARNFHPTLSHLRRALIEAWEEVHPSPPPPPLLFVHGSYRLNPDIAWEVDLDELSTALEEGRRRVRNEPETVVEIWRRAAALYRGPFLAGVYDAWAEPLRDRYQRRWLDLLKELADLNLELGHLTEAIDAYRQVLIEDPLREPVHQALMRVYSKQGRRDLVRRQYDRLTNLLTEDLGVEPLAETTEEYHRLMG